MRAERFTGASVAMQSKVTAKAARDQYVHVCLWSIGSAVFWSGESPGSGDATQRAGRPGPFESALAGLKRESVVLRALAHAERGPQRLPRCGPGRTPEVVSRDARS